MEKKCSISQSPPISFLSMAVTPQLFTMPTAVAPLLTSFSLPSLSDSPAPGRCFRTWVLITSRFLLPFSFPTFPFPWASSVTQFSESALGWLALYINWHCPSAEKNFSFSISSATTLLTSLALNAAKSLISFGRLQRQPEAWWSSKIEETVKNANILLPLSGLHLSLSACAVRQCQS